MAKIIVELKEENARLKEELNTNSKNSSPPLFKDLKKKKQIKQKSNRAHGGEPGHKAHQRVVVPIEAVDHIVLSVPWRVIVSGGCTPNDRKI